MSCLTGHIPAHLISTSPRICNSVLYLPKRINSTTFHYPHPSSTQTKNSFYFLLKAHQKEGSAFRIFHFLQKYTLHFYFLESIASCSWKILIFPPELVWILLYIQIVEQIISLIFKDFEKKSVNIRNQFTILTSSHINRFKDQGNRAREFTKPFIIFS